LEEYLKGAQKDKHIDYLTLSGNGEPTLHPNLEEIIQGILRLRDIYTKDTKVAILSNSSMVTISKVRSALNMLDLRVMKLDAGTQAKFKEVNGPLNNISLDQIIEGLKVLDDLTVQSMFIKGEVENIGERDIYEWSEQIKEISPRYLQIYTIDRPPANPRIKRVEQEILGDIAGVIRKKSGAQIRVYA
jgi:wyosine [tRNA(Phe)-imidazoG37] synthetase (radical SAM superfamily)